MERYGGQTKRGGGIGTEMCPFLEGQGEKKSDEGESTG